MLMYTRHRRPFSFPQPFFRFFCASGVKEGSAAASAGPLKRLLLLNNVAAAAEREREKEEAGAHSQNGSWV